jgi:processive 1,2-diacylglycerol beta-glucosyltransferase
MTTGEVIVVSGSYGTGHDAAADALAHQLRSAGHVVRRLDVADEMPWHIGGLLRRAYFTQLRLAPRSWGLTLRSLERDRLALRLVRLVLALLGRRLVTEVTGAKLVVSTHPFASQALGQARARGQLSAPVVTYLTDASVHRLWVHPHVDLHLAMHGLTMAEAVHLGGRAAVVRPVITVTASHHSIEPGWIAPWPAGRPAALVVGGSCGVGELYTSALDLLATGLVTPVVACGNNDRLREQLEAVPGVVALGWRTDMRALVGAASCVVQNAGGMTSLESLAAGTPTITYRAIPGHGTTNAAVLSHARLVPWVEDLEELAPALVRALVTPESTGLPDGRPEVVDLLVTQSLLSGPPSRTAVAA